MPNELWKSIVEYPNYQVSNLGRIKNNRGYFLKQYHQSKKWNYLSVCLSKKCKGKNFKVHRLVLNSFIGKCPQGHECNHKNGIKIDNRIENLEWVTSSENQYHAIRNGLKINLKGEDHGMAKLKNEDVIKIKKLLNKNEISQRKIGVLFNVDNTMINKIATGKNWGHIIL